MSPGFPRIRRRLDFMTERFQSTPTVSNQKDYDTAVAAFELLVADRQGPALTALMKDEISWGEVIYLYRRQELTGTRIMAKVKLGRPLWQAIEETLPSMGKADATRNAYKWSLLGFRRQTVVPWPAEPMLVADLAKVQWSQLAAGWPNSPSDWNHVVTALRAFLTKFLGSTRHEFREAFGKLVALEPEDARVPDITPERFAEILGQLPKHAAAIAMGLLLTGFRDRSEFFASDESNLMPAKCQVRLFGKQTKSKRGRVITIDEDLWPWIVASIPAPIKYRQFLRYWHRACVAVGAGVYVPTGKVKVVRVKLEHGQNYVRVGHLTTGKVEHERQAVEVPQVKYEGLRPHDLRHALGQWTTDEGLSLSRIKVVLGHRSTKTTERYTEDQDRGQVAAAIGDVIRRRVLNK